MWLIFAVSAVLLTIFVIGSFVWLRGTRSRIHISFSILAYAITFWVFANFLGANYKSDFFSLYATKADFMSGCVLAFAAWFFSAALLSEADRRRVRTRLHQGRVTMIMGAFSAVAAITTLAPQVIKLTRSPNHELVITYGPAYLVFALCLAVVVGATVVNLYFARRLARGRLRQQVSLMLAALLLSAVLVGFANLLLPQISHSANINLVGGNLSYLGIAFFVGATFYSIVRHRLFDLRLVLARSVAYLLLLSVLTTAYAVLTLIISNTLIKDYKLSGRAAIVPVASIVLLTFTVNPLGKFFNKITNRLFYKDSYEPRQFLGDLNETIISNVDIKTLLEGVAQVIERYLKTAYVAFDLHKTAYAGPRIIGSDTTPLHPGKLSVLHSALDAHKSVLIVADELSQDQEPLRRLLASQGVAVASALSTLHGQRLGYLVIGNKRNGSAYTSQDLEMIGIASGELVIAIQNALRFEEIEEFNETLQQKIEDATRKLRQTNEKLRKLDETKDDFISMASHQLRTPLTSIKGYTSMVLEGDAGRITPLQRKLLNQAFTSSQRMVYLISDLLNVSRLRTGKFIIEPTPTNLAQIIKDEIDQLVETAKGRNLQLVYHKPDHFPTYMLDETKLRQVIMNFIDNAIYYTPSGGHITVSLLDKPQAIEFIVTDDGIGVPKNEQHHLFTKFYRAHNAKQARPDGTGLGLFMAKKVVLAQGGATIFKSQPGKGSTFGFTFAKAHLTDAPTKH